MPFVNIIEMHQSFLCVLVGLFLLYSLKGMLRLVGVIDPVFPWLKITL